MFAAHYPLAVAEPASSPPARTLGDGALATRISEGRGSDREAERELCRRFADRIRLHGLRHLRDGSAAGDLVQDVLVTVLDRLRAAALREPDRLGSFVLGTCRLAVYDRRRGVARRAGLLARFGADLADAAPAPVARVDDERLDGCLEGLPARERAVVQLTFYAERSSDEIARELETTPGNVRIIRHRAMVRLRACMGVEEVGP